MYYGIEQSTDLRCPKTVVKKFTNKKGLLKWMEISGDFTYADPKGARNHHHTFRYGYELTGRIDRKHRIFKDSGTGAYPRNDSDNIASYLYEFGVEIKAA